VLLALEASEENMLRGLRTAPFAMAQPGYRPCRHPGGEFAIRGLGERLPQLVELPRCRELERRIVGYATTPACLGWRARHSFCSGRANLRGIRRIAEERGPGRTERQ